MIAPIAFPASTSTSAPLLGSAVADTIAANALRALGIEPQERDQADVAATYVRFKKALFPPYEHLPHQVLLDEYLLKVERYVATGGAEGIGRLLIFMQPRIGKSLNVSQLYPSFFIGRHPDVRLMTASYGASLAYRNSRVVRNLIRSDRYAKFFPGVQLASDSHSVKEWNIEGRNGGMIAAGVKGGLTGHGAKLLIIDDPIKSRAEAESATVRERLKEFWGDAYTRLEEPGAAVIVMHTRWHEDDLAGFLLKEFPKDWVVLSLPALAEEGDPLGRQPGEALWPARYPVEVLLKTRDMLGDYRFSAEYQQTPRAKEGRLFDTALIEIVNDPPPCTQIVRFYDLAITEKSNADYTAGVKLGVTEDERFVILHVSRVQKEAPAVQELIVQNAIDDSTDVPIRLEAEKAGIIQLQYLLEDGRMRPYTIDAVPPHGDKYTRAGPFAVRVNNKRVLMVKGEWNRAYLDELAMFPKGSNDDQVDASSGAYDMLGNGLLDFRIIEVDL